MNKRLHAFFIGERSFADRLPESILSSLAVTLTVLFFGPLDLTFAARDFVSFTGSDILLECAKWWFAVFVVFFLCAWLPGGWLHTWFVSIYTGLALAFYVQAHWLNPDLGVLDGTAVDWTAYAPLSLINIGVFLFIVLIPLLIRFFSAKVWKGFVLFISAELVFMQGVAQGSLLLQERKDQKRYYVSKEDEYVLGSEENIIVFVLDFVSGNGLKSALAEFPDMLEPIHDFIYFDNMNTQNYGTFPGAAYLLTNQIFDFENETPEEYFERAWRDPKTESFYTQMREAGWEINIYNDLEHTVGKDRERVYGKYSNLILADGTEEFSIRRSVFKKLIYLSLYRYFPLIMKAPFWIDTEELANMKQVPEAETPWEPFRSIEKFWESGVTTGDHAKVYRSYHFIGAHLPTRLDRWGNIVQRSVETSTNKQLAGHFNIIAEYIHYLKDLELYDSSTLVITTDHGSPEDPSAIFFIKPAGRRFWKLETSHAPVTQGEYMETISQAAGLPAGQFGRSVFDVPEDEKVTRCSYVRDFDGNFPPPAKGKHDNVLIEYCTDSDIEEMKKIIREGKGKTIYCPNSYY